MSLNKGSVDSEKDVTEIRNPLDISALDEFFRTKKANPKVTLGASEEWPDLVPPLAVKQFKFGQSNPTYLLVDANNTTAVLRRKPMANKNLVSKSAHAIEREFHMLRGVGVCNLRKLEIDDYNNLVPIPEVYLLCEDESVIGYAFYIMDFVKGRLFQDPSTPGLSESEKVETWNALIGAGAAIHSIDCNVLTKELPPEHFPHLVKKARVKTTFFKRQVKSLHAISKKQSEVVPEIPYFDKICSWLNENSPEDPEKETLIHGDLKLDNVIFHPTEPKIIAILDWELCSFGHPLFDLANVLQPFSVPAMFNQLSRPGTKMGREFGGDKVVERSLTYYNSLVYLGKNNNPKDYWKCGVVFGLLRLSVITQGIAMRSKKGNASSANAKAYAGFYPVLAEIANDNLTRSNKL